MFFPWYAMTMLGLESVSVITKRLAKVSRGGLQSVDEVQLMFAEKAEAARAAGVSLMFGCTIR